MKRITEKMLEAQIAHLNELTGMPPAPYALGEDGRYHPCAGSYYLSHAYGGVCLYQMSMRAGCSGVTTPLVSYHEPKRNLYNRLNAYISGIQQGAQS